MAANTCFTVLLYVFSAWYSFQEQCLHREQEAAAYIFERYENAWCLTDGNETIRDPYDDPEELQRGFSRWRYGCTYTPIVDVFVPSTSLDLNSWNQILSFRYLEELSLRDCQLDPDVDFSGYRYLQDLEIAGTALSLRQVRSIAKLTQLEKLSLDEASDDWLRYIGRLNNLRVLVISGGDFSDDGIAKLGDLKRLRGLGLGGTRFTSKSASWISKCKDLEWMCLAGTKIDDEGVKQLTGLAELKVLRLDDTQITDSCLASLAQLPNLEDLWLTNTNVTDAGIRKLAERKRLRNLDLSGTHVTNASVPVLAGLPLLKPSKYSVKNTKIDEAGLKQWQAARASSPQEK